LIVVVSTTTVGVGVVFDVSLVGDVEVFSLVGVGEDDGCSVAEDVGGVSDVLDGVEEGVSLLLGGVLLGDGVELVLSILDVVELDFEVDDVFVGVGVVDAPVLSCTLIPFVITPSSPLLSSCRPKILTESNQFACAMATNARIDSARR